MIELTRAFHAGEVIADRASLSEHGPDWDSFMVCRRHAVKKRRSQPAPTPAGPDEPPRGGDPRVSRDFAA